MSKLPLPLRNYEHIMLMAKRRLMFIEQFNDQRVDILKVEMVAVQMRKIIEGIAYACVSACELGGEVLNDDVRDSYSADRVFSELSKLNYGFVPRPCSFSVAGEKTVDNWEISNPGFARSDAFFYAKDYSGAYKKLHQYAHEFHPHRPHHMLHKDGLDRAISFLRPIKTRLTNSLWKHMMVFGNSALLIDFGGRDEKPPETFVFRRGDGKAAWPFLFVLTDPRNKSGKAEEA
jgi:hypothetical protein